MLLNQLMDEVLQILESKKNGMTAQLLFPHTYAIR